MNPENLQQQINERCPCFAKPLSECDCEAEVSLEVLGIKQGVHCKCKGYWHINTCLCPKNLEEYLAMIHEQSAVIPAVEEVDSIPF